MVSTVFDSSIIGPSGIAIPVNTDTADSIRADSADRRCVRPSSAMPMSIGFVSGGDRSRMATAQLVELLSKRSRSVVLSDAPAGWSDSPVGVRSFPADFDAAQRERHLHRFVAGIRRRGGRALVDLSQKEPAEELSGMLVDCEEVLWLVEPAQSESSLARLQAVLRAAPGIASRLRLVWVREPGERMCKLRLTHRLATPDFQLRLNDGTIWRRDLLRLAHHLDRQSLGVALGGGGARGAAHVGVLRALEQAGIVVDMIAGTSMGAYIAVAYACGFSHDRVLDLIASEMATPRKWRLLPGGGLAHMAYMYRRGGWRKKARQYFGEPAFEDLALPTYTVAADLLSGKSVVRGKGDAVEALLESINFPGLAKPILREGMALVDGGVLNNLPSDVVRQRGADRVIAVDVNGKFQNTFGRSATAAAPRHPSAMETLLRVLEVRMRKLSRSRSHAPDLLIAPDVGGFGFTDYDRAHEAAARGQEAAEAMIPALQVMLAGRTA